MSIEVSHLTKIYDKQKAVNDISFNIRKGEIVGFLGPNGAGKSTTMKIITGFLLPTSGVAKVCGMDVVKDPLAVKKKTGYLPESNPLYYDMYVKEYLQFVAGIYTVPHIKESVAGALEMVGIGGIEQNKKIGQLSKGYKQRVGLAAALIHNPEVLILDEPTSGLDPNQIVDIRNVIKEQGKNKTVLFSSHILQEVEAICDRIIIINKGNIVADNELSQMQDMDNTGYVVVSFKEHVNEALLQSLADVEAVTALSDFQWKLSTKNADKLRKEILSVAIANNLNITSLSSERTDLETIFRSLTK